MAGKMLDGRKIAMDVWDPNTGSFCAVEVPKRERPEPITDAEVRSGVALTTIARLEAAGIRVTDTPEEALRLNLAAKSILKVQASIAEANTHETPLNGRKMLADMEFLMNEVLGRAGDLEYSRKRADEADAEVERLRALGNARAACLRRRDTQVVELQAGLAELKGGPNDGTTSNAVQLGAARARIKHLEKELAQRDPPSEAGPWDWLLVDMAGNYRSGDECWSSDWEHGERVTEARAREFAKEHQGGLGCLAISMADAKQRDDDDRWVIRSGKGDWWRAPGDSVTDGFDEAHRYSWLEAKRLLGSSHFGGRSHVIHISDAAP